MHRYFGGILFVLCIAFSLKCNAQGEDSLTQDSTLDKNRFLILPVVFFVPETRWGGGAAGMYAFRLGKEAVRPSQVQLIFAYTQEKQLLFYSPYRLFWKGRQYTAYGEIGYYRFSYFFYGVGNDANSEELFSVNFPRIRATILKRCYGNFYIGPRYWFENYIVTDTEVNGILDSELVSGASGGITSGPGLVSQYDNRDNVFFPSKGLFIEGLWHLNAREFGSDFSFVRYQLDAVKYLSLDKNSKHILALNAFGEFIFGDPPFNQFSLVGGGRKMRGFYRGRYRDKKQIVLQTEYRAKLFWRFWGTTFFNYGGIAEEFGEFRINQFRYTYGGGLRFVVYPKKKINLRFDAAFGPNKVQNFYFTVGEAF